MMYSDKLKQFLKDNQTTIEEENIAKLLLELCYKYDNDVIIAEGLFNMLNMMEEEDKYKPEYWLCAFMDENMIIYYLSFYDDSTIYVEQAKKYHNYDDAYLHLDNFVRKALPSWIIGVKE